MSNRQNKYFIALVKLYNFFLYICHYGKKYKLIYYAVPILLVSNHIGITLKINYTATNLVDPKFYRH